MSRAVSPVSGRRSATSRLRARRTFRRRRIPLHAREILIEALDEPGALGELALVMAMAGINIDSVSVTTKGHVVVGVDDLAGATHMAGGMAVMSDECGFELLDLLVNDVY